MPGNLNPRAAFTYDAAGPEFHQRILHYAEHPEYLETPKARSLFDSLEKTAPLVYQEAKRIILEAQRK
jgi:hypothetical protein